MRQTCEIIADIKDGKDVPYEEMKMALLVLDAIVFQYKNDVKHLLKGGLVAESTKSMWYSDPETSSAEYGISTAYWKAIKSDPISYLGPSHIPGTEEWKRVHSINMKILDKGLKNMESKTQE